ncbi:MAG: DEAD/DEAH box helicase [Jatrophihabitans sp.]
MSDRGSGPGAETFLAALRSAAADADPPPLRHLHRIPATEGISEPWPDWVPDAVIAGYSGSGIGSPWRHQVQAAQAAHDGLDVAIATGTASGKSLAFGLPALSALHADDRARVLYLAPTKALAADQLRGLRELHLPFLRAATFDGDTPDEERDWVRSYGNWVLTNPDMLHAGLLPGHRRWASFWRRLRYVVVDECHTYRGLFGAHVAHVLRRLQRVCASYGASPTFVLASATSWRPATSAARLIGRSVVEVSTDDSPHGERTFALWEPTLTSLRGEQGAPVRRTAGAEAAAITAALVAADARVLTFVRSRRGAETLALQAARHLVEEGRPDLADRVSSYRGGYLPEERRAIESALGSGFLRAVAATNALELGIDITGLDAVVIAGYPGSLASMWQQAGRAGRAAQPSLVVLVARDDPLDTYLVQHPARVFDRPLEATVFDPGNPNVLGPQLCCAAAELPITRADLPLFGGPAAESQLAELVARGLLRRRPAGWYWASDDRPRADIRGGDGATIAIVEKVSGALLGTVDFGAALRTVHDGAVYLHLGRTYVVEALDLADRAALVRADDPDWTTAARELTEVAVVGSQRGSVHGPVTLDFGEVEVRSQVVGYQRRRRSTGEIIDETPLNLPVGQLATRGVWLTIDSAELAEVGLPDADVAGALHAAEHAVIALLPLFATCDRWDIGGVSTAMHPDTGRPTIFVYDGYPGGAGFAERGHQVMADWLAATRDAIAGCECLEGCPSCVQSPTCGSGNTPLDKAGAVQVLRLAVAALGPVPD